MRVEKRRAGLISNSVRKNMRNFLLVAIVGIGLVPWVELAYTYHTRDHGLYPRSKRRLDYLKVRAANVTVVTVAAVSLILVLTSF